jgi:hypothetical protein
LNPANQTPDNRFAAELRGFGPIGIIAILLIILTGNIVLDNMLVLPVGAVLALVGYGYLIQHGEIGYIKPKIDHNYIGGFAFGIAFKF